MWQLEKFKFLHMKRIIVSILPVLLSGIVFAQGSFPSHKGSHQLTIGLGVNSFEEGHSLMIPPIRLGYDIGVHDVLSIEPYFQISGSAHNWHHDPNYYYDNKYKYSGTTFEQDGKESNVYLDFGARLNLHWGNFINGLPQELDLYSGLGLGFSVNLWKKKFTQTDYSYYYTNGFLHETVTKEWSKTVSDTKTGMGWGLTFVGCRWYFEDNWGIFTELGWNLNNFLIGAAFRL